MTQLCFGTFAATMQHALKEQLSWWNNHVGTTLTPTNKTIPTQSMAGQHYTVLRLLSWLIDRDDITDRKGKVLFIDDSVASKLINQSVEMNAAIVQRIQVGDLDDEALLEFQNIVKELIKYKVNDLLQEMSNLIKDDPEVSEAQKDELLGLCKKETLAQFLSSTFLYACCLKNKLRSVDLDSNDGWLIHISDNVCPICRKVNLSIGHGTSIKSLYESVEFSATPGSDKMNRILICVKCYRKESYKKAKDGSEPQSWKTLRKIYSSYMLKQEIEQVFENNNLNSEIENVLKALLTKPKDESLQKNRPENWEPKKVTQKIKKEEWMLADSIKSLADAYYFYVRSVFDSLDNRSGCCFKNICEQVSSCYLEVAAKTDDQRQIFYGIKNWIARHAGVPENSQEALVITAFFVQNCEVFGEVSE
ncbi:hypothetical protein QP450_01335 [Gardnerella vaginalis]|uniref:ABC-three component system protein n=1 Tax=Gardnerella vaginalis TaxID=2702 RepID=UPI00254E7FDC|nr:ABC-three component system protein [Gardnerella vaginalis]MDK7259399.1 hypothetical protein [Gardnerella vaginalis]MDK8776156.1 hypothetical protein [Gardnerella vaginalis]